MEISSLTSCCGIGELNSLKARTAYVNFWSPTKKQIEEQRKQAAGLSGNDIEYLVFLIEKARDTKKDRKPFNVVIATTPDCDGWWMFHIALPMAGFIPVCACPSRHDNGRYDNILWVFERNRND